MNHMTPTVPSVGYSIAGLNANRGRARNFVLFLILWAILILPLTAAPVRATASLALSEQEIEEDFAAFWDILENSYPMFGLLEEQGVDMAALRAEGPPPLSLARDAASYRDWYQRLVERISGGGEQLGHLLAVPPGFIILEADYQSYLYCKNYEAEDPWLDIVEPVLGNPRVISFYELAPEPPPEGEPPVLEIADNLQTAVHTEENWAYLRIRSFLNQDKADDEIIRNFLKEADAVGHLLIDIRGNLGGYNDYWLLKLVAPNIREPLKIRNYGLYRSSAWTKSNEDYYASSSFEEDLQAMKDEQGDLPSLVFTFNPLPLKELPEMAKLDKKAVSRLDRCLAETIWIFPTEEQPLFNGKIWLLIDGSSYSASEYFASFCKRTGFATLAGQAAAGDGACVLTLYTALPRSGLIIRYNLLYGLNPDGTSSEMQSTEPDIQAPDGADALELILERIREE